MAPSADAALASSTPAPVLVPRHVSEDDPTAADPLDALARAVDAEVKASLASRRKPKRQVVVYAATTLDYGCLCPPFVFSPFHNSGRPDSYVLPLFAKGVPDPALTTQGAYRLLGHFEGRRMTGRQWLRLRHEKVERGMSEYARKAPVFVVDGWCFEPAESFADRYMEDAYRSMLEQLERDGRFCAGSSFPASARGED